MDRFPAQPNRHNPLPLACPLTVRPTTLLPLLLLFSLGCDASPGARWRQGWNLGGAPAIPATSPADHFASLRLQARGGGHAVIARNLLSGPVQVQLRGLDAPAPPHLLAANEERLLTWLPGNASGAHLVLDAVPGDPAARPDAYRYQLPFRQAAIRVSQAFGGRFSHGDAQNLHAVDFPLPEGTPVLAARAGTVMQVIADSPKQGCLVRVLHGDGSIGLYAHLQSGGLQVRPGQRVQAGQVLARSGNTGRSSGPHLHFAVQANTGLALVSVPFRMDSPNGELRFPREDR